MLIKRKLPLITIVLAILPLMVVSGLFYHVVTSTIRQENEQRIKQLIEMEQGYLDQFLSGVKTEVEYLSANKEIQERIVSYEANVRFSNSNSALDNGAGINKYLKDFVAEKPHIRDAFMITKEGIIIGSSNEESMSLNLTDRAYYQKAMNGETNVSELLIDRVKQQPVFFVATPIYDNVYGDILGVFATLIDLDAISDNLLDSVNTAFETVYLLDGNNRFVFHTDSGKIGEVLENESILAFVNDPENVNNGKVINVDSASIFTSYKTLESSDWKLVSELQMAHFNAVSSDLGYMLLIILLSAIAVTLIVIVKFAKSITKPMSHLTRVLDEVAEGELGIRAQYQEPNELGMLATHLNSMLDEMASTYEVFKDMNDRLTVSQSALKVKVKELERSEEAVKQIQSKHLRALDVTNDIIWEYYPDSDEKYVSKQWDDLLVELDIEESADEFFICSIVDETYKKDVSEAFKTHEKGQSENIFCEFKTTSNVDANHAKWMVIKGRQEVDKVTGRRVISGILADITQAKVNEAKIVDLAFVDQLTRLPNRTSFNIEFESHLKQSEALHAQIALCILDIDDFKNINDRFGHGVGDYIINALANRFKSTFTDHPVKIYRVSGDEFAFVINQFEDYESIINIVKQIFNCFQDPFVKGEQSLNIMASVGIAVYPEHGFTSEQLIQNADTAVYRAKELGKGKFIFYEHKMSEYVIKRFEIEKALYEAIDQALVYMVYQPQYDVWEDKIVGYEALMRMTLSDGQMVSPGDFIPIAEENGTILKLGYWSIRDVCNRIKHWHDEYGFEGTIGVNVSGIQLKHPEFVNEARRIVEETGIDISQLVFEITESAFMETNTTLLKQLEALKRMGVKLSLDDFGTGYSSFSYLRLLPLHSLKIDKSFVDFIETNPKDAALLRQIVEIAHELELTVVAEGVEDAAQLNTLKHIRCDKIQGYYISRPLDVETIEAKFLTH